MQIRKIKLINFRGYRNTIEISVDEAMTGIVARNDFSKSPTLEVLAILFEIDRIKAYKNYMNCFSMVDGETHFEISCEFDDLPPVILIDERVNTTLASEHLLNSHRYLEKVKKFKASTTGKPD